MRLLHDGTFHCPAYRSEVFLVGTPRSPSRPDQHTEAYWAGWVDGRFGKKGSFVDNPNLVKWENPSARLAYYRGHRAGNEAHSAWNSRNADTHEELFG
jgi:hypothetical protein